MTTSQSSGALVADRRTNRLVLGQRSLIGIALLLFAQVVILNKGPGLRVGYEPDEVRELQIAVMIFVYTLWIRRKAWALAPRVGSRYAASDRNA